MKNKRNAQKGGFENMPGAFKGKRIWKITAITVLIITALLIAAALIKAYYFRSYYTRPTQAQIDYSTKIAKEKLQSSGYNASDFKVQVGRKIKRMHEEGNKRTIIQVSFKNNITDHEYILDVNTGEVLLHSQTDTYIALGEEKNDGKEFFEHQGMK